MSSSQRSIREQAVAGHIEFLHETFLKAPGLLEKDDLKLLREHNLITGTQADTATGDIQELEEKIIPLTVDRYTLSIPEYLSRFDKKIIDEFENRQPMVADWKPETPEFFSETFVEFILSTHKRFCDMAPNREFYAYITQCQGWMNDLAHTRPKNTQHELDTYRAMERARCKANTMYLADRYGRIKDGDPEEGTDIYVSNLAHAQMFFLFDQRRSQFEAKVRQMASSTSKGFMHVRNIAFVPGRLQVMIANDKESGDGLLEDKVKWAFDALPAWIRPKRINTPNGYLRVTFRQDGTLSEQKADSSDIEVRTPAISAINSRKPLCTTVDEASFIAMFEAMMKEARPTMFRYNPRLGRRVMDGQIIAFSTGGRSTSGNGSYEREFRGEVEKWRMNDFSECIVPTFYDWTCVPGISQSDYLREMKAYAAGSKQGHTDLSIQERMTQFRQHYPSSIDDVFLTSKATLVSLSLILGDVDRVNKAESQGVGISYGRFEPVFSQVKMESGSPFKFKIIGATWKPSDDRDVMAPVQIWMHPDHTYDWRYYQGTDPIEQDTGTSNMSSVVIDDHYGSIAALVNMRTMDPVDSYLQVALMGLYYGNGKFIPELVEVDMGKDYMSFKSGPWLDGRKSLVGQWILPSYMQGRNSAANTGRPDIYQRLGVSSKGGNKTELIGRIKDAYLTNHKKWYFMDIFSQFLHFVGVPVKGLYGGTKWKSEDTNKYQDDLIMALGYGYLCRLCYPTKAPVKRAEREKLRQRPVEQFVRIETPYGVQTVRAYKRTG